jgi:ATP-dependent RNA helicase RhlE
MMKSFDDLGLPQNLLDKLTMQGIAEPTPIQYKVIPHALEGRDVLGLAQTGTGKTAAFALPLLARILKIGGKREEKSVQSLILAPTRELANQIETTIKAFVDGSHLRVRLVVGGVSIAGQIKKLSKGSDVLVATPGRLIDLIERNAVQLTDTKFLVLDEADQMLDLGFIHSLRKIAELLPVERQTMLFSATMPKKMGELAANYLRDPIRVEAAPSGKVADKITQSIHFVSKQDKNKLLTDLLGHHKGELSIVFSRTKHGAEKLLKTIIKSGFSAVSIHGNKSQSPRERALRAFRAGENKVLVATDVAARGLDIPLVKHVYNFDLPNVAENYVHRIGRTARAGSDGCAIAFCSSEEISELKAIQKILGASIPVASGKPWVDFGAETGNRKNSKPRSKNGWNRKKFSGSSKKKNPISSPQKSSRGRSGKATLVA